MICEVPQRLTFLFQKYTVIMLFSTRCLELAPTWLSYSGALPYAINQQLFKLPKGSIELNLKVRQIFTHLLWLGLHLRLTSLRSGF